MKERSVGAYIGLVLCACVSGCAAQRAAQRVAKNVLELEPEDREHYKATYSGSTSSADRGLKAIESSRALLQLYHKAFEVEQHDPGAYILLAMARQLAEAHLAAVCDAWSPPYHPYRISPDGLAVGALAHECNRVGVGEAIVRLRGMLGAAVSQLEQSEHPSTYQAFATISLMLQLAKKPRGSYLTYTAEVRAATAEAEQLMSLAKLEFLKDPGVAGVEQEI